MTTATRTDADLVVLGSAWHGPFGRFAVGSVTNEMLDTAPVPVVLTPRGYSPASDARLHRVTCAFAGSTRSRTAFDAAVQLSKRHSLPLRLTTLVARRQADVSLASRLRCGTPRGRAVARPGGGGTELSAIHAT